MKTTNFLIIAVLSVTIWTTACQTGAATTNKTVNSPEIKPANNTREPEAKPPIDNPPETAASETDKFSADSLATPTDAYKFAFAARQNRDAANLKKALSKEMLEFFTGIGKSEGKTLDDELKQLANQPQAGAAEVRGEKINGGNATLEYRDERGNWKTMDFVKETDGWKLTIPDGQLPRN